MIETFTALLFAHVLADFVFQTKWINDNKARPQVLLLHAVIVLFTAQLALGIYDAPQLLMLALVHLIIDALKQWGDFRKLSGFLWDQAAHLLSLLALAAYAPTLWGAWPDVALPLMALTTGAIIATRAGGFAVGLLMQPHSMRIRNNGLKGGGWTIGILERGLVFVLILADLPLGVGFLVAAKSILRFGTASRDQRTAEYVIIGTLASFGWAILAGFATQGLLSRLPTLEITALLP
ncbi:Protein of unknown function [Aliiroseovarius halocynthiae]|uniref:DUF3307 domain-containing protein n=1 Tax=Aliiroseovarius halocynthiae TaxID=985055 RepID=A0A545SSD2_9RHOB|nr:DUF3307 domain-containing protein [Aliiroseovarius halocynthiae]TQV67826.1 DUF3307 domain-containing protein [Aliiroseovarius halocynthiae]SMR72917.1 Protein of unknown function [Aliiroseovarius halocynthiae]